MHEILLDGDGGELPGGGSHGEVGQGVGGGVMVFEEKALGLHVVAVLLLVDLAEELIKSLSAGTRET